MLQNTLVFIIISVAVVYFYGARKHARCFTQHLVLEGLKKLLPLSAPNCPLSLLYIVVPWKYVLRI